MGQTKWGKPNGTKIENKIGKLFLRGQKQKIIRKWKRNLSKPMGWYFFANVA